MIVYNEELKKLSYEQKVGNIKRYNTKIKLAYTPTFYLITAKRVIYSQIYIKQIELIENIDKNFDYEFWYQLGAVTGMYYRATHHTYKNKERIPFYHSKTPFPQKILNYFNEWDFTATTTSRYSTYFFIKKFKKAKWYKYVKNATYPIPIEALESKKRLAAFFNGFINILMGKGIIILNNMNFLAMLKMLLYSVFGLKTGLHFSSRQEYNTGGKLVFSKDIINIFDVPNFKPSNLYNDYYDKTTYRFLSIIPSTESSAVYELPDGWEYLYRPDVINGIMYKI